MSKIVAVILGFGITLSGFKVVAQTSNYLDANGPQPWGINIPIENGFINVANGDLHLEIQLGNHPQRGQVSVNESIVYDSRFWHIVPNGSGYKWQSGNGTGQFAGWSVPLKADNVQVVLQAVGSCDVGMTFTDISGATHQFIVPNYAANCSKATLPAYALDGSGYSVSTVQRSPGNYTFYINDPNGTSVYNSQLSPITLPTTYNNGAGEEQIDRNGNCYGNLCSGTDTLGHTPIVESQTALDGNGNFRIYYDVLTTSGATKRYTVNVETLLLTTSFHQSGVSEFSNYVYNIQSIQLPDGSSYSFSYEPGYGELQTMTLPTGGVVSLYWQNFFDSYQNENRWIYSYQGGHGAYQFSPSVVTQCVGSAKTGCQESMKVDPFDPNHGYVTYLLTLNGGAWNTQEDSYENGVHLISKAVTNTLINSCPSADTSFCGTATWLSSSSTKTTLVDTGQTSTVQTDYVSPQYGKATSIRYWDYGVPTTATPTKHWLANFSEIVNGAAFITADALLDGTNTQISSNVYAYDEQAPTATSGLPNHVTPLGLRGNLTSVTTGVSTKLSGHFTYDDTGQLLTAKDPKANIKSFGYSCSDAYQNQVTYPVTANGLTLKTQTVYDCNLGLPIQQIGMNGEQFGTNYDTIGRVETTSSPDGGGSTYSYPSPTEVDISSKQTASISTVIQSHLDSYGRPYQNVMQAPEGELTSETDYGFGGRPQCINTTHNSSSSPTDGSTCRTYDVLGRVTQLTMPDYNTISYSYSGNSTTMTDEMGHKKKSVHDAFGRLTSVFEPDSTGALIYETDYVYNGFDKLLEVDQWGGSKGSAGNRQRLFGYDSLGRLIAENVPENASSSGPSLICTGLSGLWTNCFQYDVNGNQTSVTDNRNTTIVSSYDALNRLILSQPSDATPASAYGYDGYDAYGALISPAITNPLGRLTHTTNKVNTASRYYYDAMGRLAQQTSCVPTGCGYAVQMSAGYDFEGNLVSFTYPDGRTIKQTFDQANRLQSNSYASWGATTINTPYLSSLHYAPPGQMTQATLGNGIIETAAYNSRQAISSLSYSNSVGALWEKTYTWDKTASNLSTLADPADGVTRQMGYDPLNRITSAVDSASSPGSSPAVVTISGTEQSITRGSYSYATATLTLYGSDNVATYYPCGISSCPTSVYDYGTVSLVVNGTSVSTSYSQGSSAASIASTLIQSLHSSTITAAVSGATITFTAVTIGTAGNGLTITATSASNNTGTYRNYTGGYSQLFFGPSFNWNSSSVQLSGGNSPGTTYDTGTVSISINGTAAGSAAYGSGSSSSSLAAALAASINGNGGSIVTATASGPTVSLVCRNSCPGANFSTASAVANNDTTNFPSGSFAVAVKQQVPNPTPTLLNQSFSYDPWGNLAQSGSFTFSPTYSTRNQVSSYTYDAAGNVTSDGLGHTFTYDGYGRIQGANGYNIYTYDVNGNRVQASATTPTEYVYFGNQLVATAFGTSISTSAWTDFVYAAGGILAEVPGTQTGSPTYRVTDHLGSLGGTFDNAGHFSGEIGFAPFGQTASGSTSDNYRFTGLEFDSFTGLDHAGARQYLPNHGRWISPDPSDGSYDWTNPQSLNRYAYVNGRPTFLTDPSGLFPPICGVTAGADGGLAVAGPAGWAALAGCVGYDVFKLLGLFGGPTFHGTLKPRASTAGQAPWNDSFGIPYRGLQNGIADAIGLSPGGCEFGACGGLGDSLVSAANTSVAVFCRGIEHPIPGTRIPLGSIGAEHCDAWIKLGGILYSISGGPIPPDGANQVLRMWVSQASQRPTGFIQYYVHGASSLGLANCLFENGWNMQSSPTSQSPAYHPLEGPNSNTLLNQLFHGCGTELGLHTHGTNF